MGNGAEVILVAVGQHQAAEAPDGLDKGRIRHLHVGIFRAVLGKGDATVHHEPAIVVAVKVEVHPDFTSAAEGEKPEIAGARASEAHELQERAVHPGWASAQAGRLPRSGASSAVGA